MNTTADAAGRVGQIVDIIANYRERYERDHDERAVFACAYQELTKRLHQALRESPEEFRDPHWVASLAKGFQERFSAAMDGIDCWLKSVGRSASQTEQQIPPSGVPQPWWDAFQAVTRGRSYVLEDLVFLMMAHISYDLPDALLDEEVGMATCDGQSHVADFHKMNDVLGKGIEPVQKLVTERYSRFLPVLDRIAGNFDEFLTNYGIRATRAVAWYNAMRLQDRASEEAARESIKRSTASFIQAVRSPDSRWLRILLRVTRFLLPERRKWPPPASGD